MLGDSTPQGHSTNQNRPLTALFTCKLISSDSVLITRAHSIRRLPLHSFCHLRCQRPLAGMGSLHCLAPPSLWGNRKGMLQGHGHLDNLNEAAHTQPTVKTTSMTSQHRSHQPKFLISFLRMEVSSALVSTSGVRPA